jgi:hypothetical protein
MKLFLPPAMKCLSLWGFSGSSFVHRWWNRWKTLHKLSRIRLICTMLPWKLNWLLHGRPLLSAQYPITIKSVWRIKPVSTNSTFRIRAPSARTVMSLKASPVSFCLWRRSPIKITTAVFEIIGFVCSGAHLKSSYFRCWNFRIHRTPTYDFQPFGH